MKPRPEEQTPCHSSFSAGIICGSGSFAVQFGDHFRSGDHLRSGIIYGAVQSQSRDIRRNVRANLKSLVWSRHVGVPVV